MIKNDKNDIVKIIKCFQNKERNVSLKVCWAFADLLKSILFLSTPRFFPLNKSLLMMIGEVSSELMMFVGGGRRDQLEVKEQD